MDVKKTKRLALLIPKPTRFLAGSIITVSIINLWIVWIGIDRYAEMVENHWNPDIIVVPMCILLIIWASVFSEEKSESKVEDLKAALKDIGDWDHLGEAVSDAYDAQEGVGSWNKLMDY